MHDLYRVIDATAAGVDLQVRLTPRVNPALLSSGVAALSRVVLRNDSSDSVGPLSLVAELTLGDGRQIAAACRIDRIGPGQSVDIDGPTAFAALRPALMGGREQVFGALRVAALADPSGRALVELTGALQVDAAGEFLNLPGLRGALAAFVQPNSRAVTRILRGASDLLRGHTGDGSFSGYQADRARLRLSVGAIYETLRNFEINYLTVPASFEGTGQKVRTTAEVLRERFGNCIDLSVTFAACLEAVGIDAAIVLSTDHAFPAFATTPRMGEQAAIEDPNTIANLIETGLWTPVELTGLNAGRQSIGFSKAVERAGAYVRSLFGDLRTLVEIPKARLDRVLPLPAGEDDDGLPPAQTRPFVSRTAPRNFAPPTDDEEEVVIGALDRVDPAPARVQQWKRSLLDLSLRNPLLNLPRNSRVVDFIVPGGLLAQVDDAASSGKTLRVTAYLEGSEGLRQALGDRVMGELTPELCRTSFKTMRTLFTSSPSPRLRALRRDAETLEQETGSNFLYLCLGSLVHAKGEREIRAPLFLMPARLKRTGLTYSFTADGDDPAQPNLCLLEWLRLTQRVELPELANPLADESGIAINACLTAIRRRLLEAGLDFRVDETVHLALLKFSTFQIWKDLDANWASFLSNPVVHHLVTRPGETFNDPAGGLPPQLTSRVEADIRLPVAADGSQLEAVLRAAAGQSFVLEGPPGTGKSQTITNLIAHALQQGQKVLFVAEKQVALEIVGRRLAEVGLAPFTLELHGDKVSLRDIRAQLRRALEAQAVTPNEWTGAEQAYTTAVRVLADYPGRLHSPNRAGLSAWSAYDLAASLGPGPSWTLGPGGPDAVDVATLRAATVEASRIAAQVGHSPRAPWLIGHFHHGVDLAALRQALPATAPTRQLVEQLSPAGRAAVETLSPTEACDLDQLLRSGRPLPTPAALALVGSPEWYAGVTSGRDRVAWLEGAAESSRLADAPELADWLASARRLSQAVLFGEFRRRQVRRAVAALAPALPWAGAGLLAALEGAAALRQTSAATAGVIRALPGVLLGPDWAPHRPGALAEFDAAVDHALKAARFCQRHPAGRWLERPITGPDRDVFAALVAAWRGWLEAVGADHTSAAQWMGGRGWVAAWEQDYQRWREDLDLGNGLMPQRYAGLRAELARLVQAGGADLADQLARGALAPADASAALTRGLAAACLRERLLVGGLDNFDEQAQIRLQEDYEARAEQLRRLAGQAIPARVIAHRPFRADQVIGEVAALARQIERKRGGLTLREVTQRYPQALLSLTPVLLASPGAVAHFLSPDLTFDIVVFDEASQIRVPEAIGAAGRGRSVVVVGDSKQMPPSRMMEVSADQSDDLDGVEDSESILSEAVESGLPRSYLRWHYRSLDESLIAFSNARYYEDRLVTIPSPGGQPGLGLSWRRVEGSFGRGRDRTNPIEAQAVVDEIVALSRDPATRDDSIGVVCFNVQQRDLILNLLEDHPDLFVQQALRADERHRLFVKNLENVQGDERDVILFSLAFSPDPDSGVLPLQFGPLVLEGGQRRLNVAITRARRRVVLFSSFDPSAIDLTRSGAQGLRDLRAYLEQAAAAGRTAETAVLAETTVLPAAGTAATEPGPTTRGALIRQWATRLEEAGLEWTTDLGQSSFRVDLALRRPGETKWRLAVLVDGPAWASRPSVADREHVPTLLTDLMGWPQVARVWLPGWLRDPEAVIARLLAQVGASIERETSASAATAHRPSFVSPDGRTDPGLDGGLGGHEDAGAEAGAGPSPDEIGGADTVEPDGASTGLSPAGPAGADPAAAEPPLFTPAARDKVMPRAHLDLLRRFPPVDPFDQDMVEDEVLQQVADITWTEGPTQLDRLVSLVGARFGLSRLVAEKREALERIVRRRCPVDSTGFVWPPGGIQALWPVRRSTPDQRGIDEISPAELLSAMLLVLRQALSTERDELFKASAAVFGLNRLTAPVRRALEVALQGGLQSGALTLAGDRVRAGGRARLG
ncbi:MAG: DUF4011 domain-containing protein [Propionibacteriaceae bacterium]|nr:DUF4011 domain-containing protein [Propionibacteriaceae bacterium]